jgi:two-component system nitrate/nitrite response regulator NarL
MGVLLIVEDEPDVRALIRAILKRDPRLEIVGEASSAAEAIDAARTVQPGLIILDHSIEGDVMGLEAAPMLKEACPSSKILLFSAFDLQTEADAEPAIDAFLSKSDVRKLLATVLDLLELDAA